MQHFIATYGYLAVFLLMLAESACIPIPSEVVMLFGGAMAAGGVVHGSHPSLIGIIAAGALGNVAGSILAWWAGRHWGQAAVRNFGRRFHIHEHDIDRAAQWFERYGPVAVLVGRVVPVVRTFISLPAGFAEMPAVRFIVYTTLGCVPWTAGLGVAGYQLGDHWDKVANAFHSITYVVVAILVLAIAAMVIMRVRRRRAAPPPPERDYPPSPAYPYPLHHEAAYSDAPAVAERFWGQRWDTPAAQQPPPERAVHPKPVPYRQYQPAPGPARAPGHNPQPYPRTASPREPAPQGGSREPSLRPAAPRPAAPRAAPGAYPQARQDPRRDAYPPARNPRADGGRDR